jgi:hypothetical protein
MLLASRVPGAGFRPENDRRGPSARRDGPFSDDDSIEPFTSNDSAAIISGSGGAAAVGVRQREAPGRQRNPEK